MKERDNWGVFPRDIAGNIDNSRAIRKAVYRIYIPLNKKIRWDGKQLSGLTSGIGAPFGYVVYHMLKQAGYLSPIDFSAEEGFKMLSLNRLDGYIIEEQIAAKIVERKQYQGKIMSLPLAYHISYFHLLLSSQFYRHDPSGGEKVWNELKRLTSSTALPAADKD